MSNTTAVLSLLNVSIFAFFRIEPMLLFSSALSIAASVAM